MIGRTLTKTLVVALALASPCAPAFASFYTYDLASVVNGNVAIGAQTFPTGVSTGNRNTAIPFQISTFGSSGYAGAWFAQGRTPSPGTSTTLTINLTSLALTGQASFFALLNNYYGQTGVNEYNIKVTATNGDSVTYSSIGGTDTRDYNAANNSNTIAATTTPWFDNGVGQRLDVRAFALPTSFLTETLASFQISQLQTNDPAFLTGLTFSTQAAAFGVPEPATIAVLGFGIAGALWARRKKA